MMNQAIGQGISAAVGFVSYLLSQGFNIPTGAEGFRFLTVFGAISGFGVGNVFGSRVKTWPFVGIVLLAVGNLIVGCAAAIIYLLGTTAALFSGPCGFVILGLTLTLAFFCIALALPLAGVSFSNS
jgi:hypothetical protein